jgi:hypothetical protein
MDLAPRATRPTSHRCPCRHGQCPQADVKTQLFAQGCTVGSSRPRPWELATMVATAEIANRLVNNMPCTVAPWASNCWPPQLVLWASFAGLCTKWSPRGEYCRCCLKRWALYRHVCRRLRSSICCVAAEPCRPLARPHEPEMPPDLPPGEATRITFHWAQSLPQLTQLRQRAGTIARKTNAVA